MPKLVENAVFYLFTGHDIGFGVEEWVMLDWRIHRSDDLMTWTLVGTIDPADNYMEAVSPLRQLRARRRNSHVLHRLAPGTTKDVD